jgi:hypothetical protein
MEGRMPDPEPYEYRLIDPTNMPESGLPPFEGTRVECLRDGLLDVIHVALELGMSPADVDAALAQVLGHWAGFSPHGFGTGDRTQ